MGTRPPAAAFRRRRLLATLAAAVALSVPAASCEGYPRDGRGSLAAVTAGTRPLRVGWSAAGDWVRPGREEPSGLEPDLVRAFAAGTGAEIEWEIEWVRGTEAELVRSLEEGTLDLAVAGFTKKTPWGARIGQSRAWITRSEAPDEEDHILAIAPGEHALALALDRFLHARRPR